MDLAAADNGGTVLDASDRFFSPPENAIRPGHAVTMGDGWETPAPPRRWLRLVAAGASRPPARSSQFYVDTMHFVGNSPGAIRLLAIDSRTPEYTGVSAEAWPEPLPRTIQPDTRHWFGRDAGLDSSARSTACASS